jgi:hypothetical protein
VECKKSSRVLTEEKLAVTRRFLVLGNLALLAWVFLAFFAEWFYNQVYGWLLLVFTSAMVYLILRRMGCSSCYHCKSCTSGFGRLAGAFFGSGSTKRLSVDARRGIIGFIYVLLVPVPVALAVLSMVGAFSLLQVFVLVCLLGLTVFSFLTWRKKK